MTPKQASRVHMGSTNDHLHPAFIKAVNRLQDTEELQASCMSHMMTPIQASLMGSAATLGSPTDSMMGSFAPQAWNIHTASLLAPFSPSLSPSSSSEATPPGSPEHSRHTEVHTSPMTNGKVGAFACSQPDPPTSPERGRHINVHTSPMTNHAVAEVTCSCASLLTCHAGSPQTDAHTSPLTNGKVTEITCSQAGPLACHEGLDTLDEHRMPISDPDGQSRAALAMHADGLVIPDSTWYQDTPPNEGQPDSSWHQHTPPRDQQPYNAAEAPMMAQLTATQECSAPRSQPQQSSGNHDQPVGLAGEDLNAAYVRRQGALDPPDTAESALEVEREADMAGSPDAAQDEHRQPSSTQQDSADPAHINDMGEVMTGNGADPATDKAAEPAADPDATQDDCPPGGQHQQQSAGTAQGSATEARPGLTGRRPLPGSHVHETWSECIHEAEAEADPNATQDDNDDDYSGKCTHAAGLEADPDATQDNDDAGDPAEAVQRHMASAGHRSTDLGEADPMVFHDGSWGGCILQQQAAASVVEQLSDIYGGAAGIAGAGADCKVIRQHACQSAAIPQDVAAAAQEAAAAGDPEVTQDEHGCSSPEGLRHGQSGMGCSGMGDVRMGGIRSPAAEERHGCSSPAGPVQPPSQSGCSRVGGLRVGGFKAFATQVGSCRDESSQAMDMSPPSPSWSPMPLEDAHSQWPGRPPLSAGKRGKRESTPLHEGAPVEDRARCSPSAVGGNPSAENSHTRCDDQMNAEAPGGCLHPMSACSHSQPTRGQCQHQTSGSVECRELRGILGNEVSSVKGVSRELHTDDGTVDKENQSQRANRPAHLHAAHARCPSPCRGGTSL